MIAWEFSEWSAWAEVISPSFIERNSEILHKHDDAINAFTKLMTDLEICYAV